MAAPVAAPAAAPVAAPAAAPVTVPLTVREALWRPPPSTTVALRPTEDTSSVSSPATPSSNGRKRSAIFHHVGRSVLGTVLGSAAVGRVSGEGNGEGVGRGTPARQLSEPQIQHMGHGKVKISVWTRNKQVRLGGYVLNNRLQNAFGLVGVAYARLLVRWLSVFSFILYKSFVPIFNLRHPPRFQPNHIPEGEPCNSCTFVHCLRQQFFLADFIAAQFDARVDEGRKNTELFSR